MITRVCGSLVNAARDNKVCNRLVVGLRNAKGAAIDRYLRIHTSGVNIDSRIVPKGARRHDDARWYEPLDYSQLRSMLRLAQLDSADVLFDIGCGMGRVLCVAARLRVARCVGIELDADLAAVARQNAMSLRAPHAPIEVITGDATEVDYGSGTVFILFNPFGVGTMRTTLQRIRDAIPCPPRALRFVYFNPSASVAFQESSWLKRTKVVKSLLFRHAVELWESAT